MEVKFKKLHENAVIPSYAHNTDAGMDLTATNKWYDEYGNVCYGTGLALEIPEGYVGLVFPRSSNCKTSLLMSNSVGVIDSGYRGEVTAKFRKDYQVYDDEDVDGRKCSIMPLEHRTSDEYNIGDRVAQLIIMPYPKVQFVEVDELSDSDRGEGSYGSTGK